LSRTDVHLPKPESFYGLALPLGGAEVSLQDLVRLYAALANNGQLRPLRRIENDPVAKNRCILSPEAAFLTLEMLGNVPRPEMNCADGTHSAPVYWKTGTSHGFRDAWSIAVFDHYVLGVWVGNFDGRANPAFVGRTAAAPLLFQIIDSLRAAWPEPSVPHLPPPGSNLKRVEFCALSGDLPNQFCRQHVEGWFIPGVSPIKTCDVHREVLVDVASSLRVPLDDGTRQLRREVYEFWPGEFLTLFEQAGIPRRVPPPFLPNNGSELASRSGQKPVIVSPSKKEIVLASTKRIPLRAKAEGDVREIFRFALRQLLKTAGFTTVAVLTLALAIGVNSAIFALINGVVLKPVVPVRPAEVMNVFTARQNASHDYRQFSYNEYRELRENGGDVFVDVAALEFAVAGIGRDHDMRRSFAFLTSENYFPMMGVQPFRGRFYNAEECKPNANMAVV